MKQTTVCWDGEKTPVDELGRGPGYDTPEAERERAAANIHRLPGIIVKKDPVKDRDDHA